MNPIEQVNTPGDAITQWQLDAKFDQSGLDVESLNIPLLHGRYLRYLSDARLKVKHLHADKRKLDQTLRSYYTGNSNDAATLATLGRTAMLHRYLRQDIPDVVAADAEMLVLDSQLDVAAEIVAVLEEILKNINTRGYQIKNAIEWRRLTNFSPV